MGVKKYHTCEIFLKGGEKTMVQSGRLLSPLEKNQRSSVLEYAAAERTKKLKGIQIHEKVSFLRIGTVPLDKIVTMLYEVLRAVGLLHYNSIVLFNFSKPMM